MRRPYKVILWALVVLVLLVGWNLFSTISFTAPMLWVRLQLSIAGKPLSPASVQKVEYCFSKAPASINLDGLKGELRKAYAAGDAFILNGPYSIKRVGFSWPATEPQYHSLYVRVTVTDQKVFTTAFPFVTDKRMNGPMFIDLPE